MSQWTSPVPRPSAGRTRPLSDETAVAGSSVADSSDFEDHPAWTELCYEILVGCWQRQSWDRASLVRLGCAFGFITLCSWLGIVLSRQSDGVATIWLSNGLLFGLLITQPSYRWLPYFVAGLTADTVADVAWGDPFHLAIGVSLANSFEVIASCIALTLIFGWPLDIAKRKSLVGFLLVSVVLATAVTSAAGASWTLYFVPGGTWLGMFRTWYLGDVLGMAILAPLTIVLQRPAFFSMFHRRTLLHTLAVLSASVLTAVLVFTHDGDPLIFLMFPSLLLVAFRLGYPGTVVNILLTTLISIEFTVLGHGPLMLILGEHMTLHRIVVAQIFAASAIFTMFPVAALLEEKDSLKDSLEWNESRFRELAHRDELTGLWNRRAFNLKLEAAWLDSTLMHDSLALLLLDADCFKEFNDYFGHLWGDECLRSLAGAIGDVAAESGGWAARFGGEEFAVLLPGKTQAEALEIAERICRSTMGLELEHPTNATGLQTLSIGVAAAVPFAGQGSTALVISADKALYVAKLAGRNRVACA